MKTNYVNIGDRVNISMDRIVCIMDADSEKVRRLLKRHGLERSSSQVIDATSNKGTKSLLILDDGQLALSNLSANVIIKRSCKDFFEEMGD